MYESYTYQIYQWLVNNNIASKIDSLVSYAGDILKAVVFFGFTYIVFKFLKKEWLSY